MALVLLYNFTEEARRKKVKAVLFRCAIPCREVAPEEQNLPLEALVNPGGPLPENPETEPPFSGEMIVMQGLNSRQFQSFLEGLKGQRITVPLKAVVTEHNIHWTSVRLHRELAAEHLALSARGGKPVHE